MKNEMKWYLDRRIACENYPPSEALYPSVEDYAEALEDQIESLNYELIEERNYSCD